MTRVAARLFGGFRSSEAIPLGVGRITCDAVGLADMEGPLQASSRAGFLMATVMITWEMGGGLGHLLPHVPLVEKLRERGHRVVMVLKDLTKACHVFGNLGVQCLQAPAKNAKTRNRIPAPRSFSGVIHNSCFEEFSELLALAEAWRLLYQFVDPDVIVFDHSPTALIAARSCRAKRVTFGTGFCCPPDTDPMPDLRPWLPPRFPKPDDPDQHVLEDINRLMDRWGLPRLDRLGQLYSQVDETILTTFPEFDHFPNRLNGHYRGIWPVRIGAAPVWPTGEGKKVFAYVKPFREMPMLLRGLAHFGVPTLIYFDGLSPRSAEEYSAPNLRFSPEPINIGEAAQQCDLAILNAGHWSTCELLLAGKPILQIPLSAEQALTAAAVSALGAGLTALPTERRQIVEKLARMLDLNRHTFVAKAFAQLHADFNGENELRAACEQITELAAENSDSHT